MTNRNISFQNTITVFAGIFGFHKLVLTVLQINFTKSKPKEIIYKDYKNFDPFLSNDEVKNVLDLDKINSHAMFEEFVLKVADKHAPVKKKVVRANHGKYISKSFWKAFMKRSYLEKVCFRKQTTQSMERYKKQKTIAVYRIKKREKISLIALIPHL